MQMTIHLRQETPRSVSYDHNYSLGSAIYEAMRGFQADVARALHESTDRAKLAVGEVYHHARRRGEASFRVASPDERLLRVVSASLMACGRMQVGQSTYAVTGALAHPSPDPLAPLGLHTLSPVYIKDRESPRSLVHDNCDYSTVLASVVNRDVKRATGRDGSVSVLRMEKLEVRKRTLAGRTIMAQKGTFWLDGDPRDLAHVLDWGVGQSTALGFGLVVPEGAA